MTFFILFYISTNVNMHVYFELAGAPDVVGVNILYVSASITCNLIVLIDLILLTTVGMWSQSFKWKQVNTWVLNTPLSSESSIGII